MSILSSFRLFWLVQAEDSGQEEKAFFSEYFLKSRDKMIKEENNLKWQGKENFSESQVTVIWSKRIAFIFKNESFYFIYFLIYFLLFSLHVNLQYPRRMICIGENIQCLSNLR